MSITVVQTAKSTSSGDSLSNSVAFLSNTTAGSLLLCAIYASAGSTNSLDSGVLSPNTPTTSGITWLPVNSEHAELGFNAHFSESVLIGVYYAANVGAITAGTTTSATVTATGGSGTITHKTDVVITEISSAGGMPYAVQIQNFQGPFPTTSVPTVGNITVVDASDIILVFVRHSSGTTVANTGWTNLPTLTGSEESAQYRVTSGTGTFTTAFASTGDVIWAAVGMAFSGAAATPILVVSPSTLTFSAAQGGSNPASQLVGVSNGNGGTLTWSVVSDESWLTPSPTSGTDTGSVTASVDITGLTAGMYTGHLTFTAAGATGSPQIVTVTLTISAPTAILDVFPLTLVFSGIPGGSNPPNQTLLVRNIGTPGTMPFTDTEATSWLSVSPSSGDGVIPVTLTVSVDTTGLTSGSYTGTITVAAPSALDSPQTVTVTLDIVDIFHYVKSFNLSDDAQHTIAFDKSGVLWEEDVVNDPLVLHPLIPTFSPDSYMLSTTQADVEYMCISNLINGTDIPRQYNPQPATGGYTLDRISQVGPGAPPTFSTTSSGAGSQATITSWGGSGSTVTFQAINSFTAGEIVTLSGFAVSTFFNNKTFSVLGTGLSGTQFEVSFAGFSGGSDTGFATPQFGYRLQGITQFAQKSDGGQPGHLNFMLWSSGPGQRDAGNVITVYYQGTALPQDSDLLNTFNSGLATYVYVSGAPFGNGTQLVTSLGSGIPPGRDSPRWYFTFQVTSNNSQGVFQAVGTYQQSIATVTMLDPIPDLSTGDQVTITSASPSAWNAQWGVVATLNSGVYAITQTSMTSGTATYTWSWAGTGSPVPPTANQLVTVIQTLNGNGIFNVVEAPIASVAGGPSSGTFTIANFPNQNIPAAAESGQAQTSGTKFEIDPGAQFLGTDQSPIYGNALANTGIVSVIGASTQIGPGTRQAVVFFETRNGLKTACSAPITFTTDNAATYIVASNIPIGPPNVIRRWIAFTGAGPNGIPGPNFYAIDDPVTYTISNQTYRYSSTKIDDNITTTAKFTFTDAILLAGEEIDVQGNDLFSQIELGSVAWNISYASRMFYGLEQNKVLNFVNLSFDGGYIPNPSGISFPLGWGVDPISNAFVPASAVITAFQISLNRVTFTAANSFTVGTPVLIAGLSTGTYFNGVVLTVTAATLTTFTATFLHANVGLTADSGTATATIGSGTGNLTVSTVFGNAYYISNQTGSTQPAVGMIIQSAYQDAYNVPVILPNTLYSVRVTARIPSGRTVGNLIIDLTDSNTGNVSGTGSASPYGVTYGTYSLPFASMTDTSAIFESTLLTSPFTQGIPVGLLLRVWAQNIGNAGDVEVDRLEIFPTITPLLSTNIRVSYIDNFEAFDANTGNIGLAAHNKQKAYGAFELHDQLYFLQTASMQSTQDIPGTEPSGPGGGWSVKEVSNRVGTCGIHAYDYGEEWVVTACRNGLYGFNGGQPIRIDFQQKELWEAINWIYGHSIIIRNDLPNRRLYAFVPLATPNQWLPEAATNANPTSPNIVIMWNYQGLGTFEELVSGQALHTTMFGTLASVDMRLKCSLWTIPTPYAGFVTQPDLTTQDLLICSASVPGKIYRLDPTATDDDSSVINSKYFTYGFVSAAKASEFPLLGLHRKNYVGIQFLLSGAGDATVSIYPNYILTPSTLAYNPRLFSLPTIPLVEQPTDDYWRPLNSAGNRVYVSVGTNAVGATFNLSKIILVGVMHPYSSVNPNT